MTIRTKVEVNGTEHSDFQNMKISKTMSEFNASSNYIIKYDNPFGRHNDDFTVGDTIEVFADQDAAPATTLLKGIIERIKFEGKGTTQTVTLIGRDFTARLKDSTVQPAVYTDSEVSTIVTDIVNNNVPDVTVNNVDVTETTLDRIAFNHNSMFDALTELAELAGFFFYVDSNSDLNFKLRKNTSSDISLDNTNILQMTSNTTREGMANSIWVYGDRYLSGFREENTLNGSPWGGAIGSVFTLLSKPHNTLVEYLGNPLKGGVYELTTSVVSGPDYLVSFQDKQLIFLSGTDINYDSIPVSGGSIITTYDREIPIVKFGENDDSISSFGKKVKVINDKTIKDPRTALEILKKELEKSDPFKGIEVEIKGWQAITPGDTLNITMDDFNIDDNSIGILGVDYRFDKNSIQAETVIKIKLDTKIKDVTDKITDLDKRIGLIESQDRQDTDVLTRLIQATGSCVIVGSYWAIQTRELGSSFVLGHSGFTGSIGAQAGGRLGSIVASGINFLGDSRNALSIITSGGYY